MLRLESSWHGRSVDHVLTYSGRQIAVGSQKPSRITRQKTCCAIESNTSVRVVFANGSGFDAPIGVVLEWEERGSCLNIFRTTNRGRISETFTNYEAKGFLRNRLGMGEAWVMSQRIPVQKSRSDLRNLHELRGKTLVAQVSQTRRSTSYSRMGVVLMLRLESSWHGRSVDHVLTYSGRQIAVGSQKPSRTTRQKTCCASESNTSSSWHGRSVDRVLTYSGRKIAVGSQKPSRITRQKTRCASESKTSVRVVFANGVVLMLRLESSWHGRSVDRVLTYSGRQIAVGSQKPSRITRQKTCCASESNTSVRVVFANRSGFDAPIGVVLAWEKRGSCLNIFRTTNRGRISGTFTNYEAKDLLRKNLHELRGKRLIAQVSQTRRFACIRDRSGFDAPIGVVLAWEERGSCLNIFRTTNRGRISETFTNYEAKDSLRKSVDHVLTYSGRQIAVGSQKPSRITRQKTRCASESNTSVRVVFASRVVFMLQLESSWHGRSVDRVLTYSGRQIAVGSQKPSRITRQKTRCASESNTSVRVVFANRSGFDAPIGVVLAWEERGSCLNIFRTTNRGRISETFTNYEAKDSLRKSVDRVLTYSGRQIAVGSQKPSRITRQKTRCASESNTSVRVVFANRSGFDAPIRVVLAWEERGSCPNIFRTTNHGRLSETLTNYEAKASLRKNLHELRGKRLIAQVSQTRRFALYSRTGVVLMLRLESSWHGRSVDRVLTYSGRQIAVGSQKPSRITRQKTRCASESNTSVRVVFANRSGFDAPIGVVLAWEERGSCLNIFRTTNRGRISETFTNYEAKDSLRKVVLMLRLESSWHRRSVDHVLTYSGRQIAVGSQKPSRITRQKTCCASESNTSVRVVFANGSGFDAPIGVVLAWEERGSCLNIFRTTNRGRISETFTNYEAKDLLRKSDLRNLHELRGKRLVAQVSETRRFALYLRAGVVLMLRLESSWHGRSVDHVLTYSGRQIAVGSQKPSRITRQKTRCASESNTSVRVVFANRSGFDAPIGVVLAWEERGSCLNIFRTTNRGRISETFTNYEAKDSLRKSVDRVLTYSGRQIAVGSQKPSRITRQKTRCASESNTSVRVVFANRSGFDAPIGVVLAWEERGSCLNIFRTTNRGRISETFTNYEAKDSLRKNLHELRGKRLVAQVSQTRRFALYSRTEVVLMLRSESSWHGRSVDRVLTYSGRQIAVGSQKPSRITRQKTCCASESNTSVRVVFANRSGFDAPIGVVLAWEERGSCLNIFRTTNRGRISETFTNYEAKDSLRKNLHELRGKRLVAQVSQTRRFALYSRTGVVLMLRLESSWHGRSVDRVLTYSGRQIAVGSQKPSRITRQKTRCASESNTSVRVVFANRSGFDAPIGVVLAWEERGSCLNIFRTTNRGRISETFTNYEAKDSLRKNLHELRGKRLVAQVSQTRRFALYSRTGVVLMLRFESSWHGRSVDRVLTYSGRQIAVGSQKPSRITRQKTRCASESNTSVRVVFANRSGFDAPIRVVLAWEERGSCLNIFRTTNRGRISETFTNYEAKDSLRKSVDRVLTYSGRQIAVGSQKPSRITRQKTRCASESNTSVRVVFANRSGFDAPIRVVLAWEERGSCLNIFRTTNRGRISETFTNYEAKDSLRKNLHELRGKRLVAQVSQTRRFALYSRTGVVLMLRLESSWHGRSVDRVLTYSGRQIAVGSQKPSRITRQKTRCASESNTSVRVVFANRSGFDAPIRVVLAWEERGSCLNIFRTTNRGRISETFTNYEAKDSLRKNLHELRGKRLVAQVSQTRRFALYSRTGVVLMLRFESSWHGRSVDRVLTYSGRQIAVGSQKPSRITRQKTRCASESNTSVRVVFANRSGFDAPIRVVLAWEERGSCLNIFRTTNRGRISETFTNYEAKDSLRKNLHELRGKRLVAQVSQTRRFALYSRTGVVLMLRFESSWHGRSVDRVLTYSGRQIAVGSQKPSRIMRQKTRCATESNTSVRVVLANRSGFDAPIRVVLAWEERGSGLNIFRTTNHGQISETFTNYEAKDSLRKNLHELRGKRLVAQVSQTRRFALYSRTGVVLMLRLESSWHGRSVDRVLTYSGRQIAVGSQKPSRITRQKTRCASESNTSVRVVFANRSGFDAPIRVVLAWEERGSCLNIFQTINRARISETFMNYEAKDSLRKNLHELRGKRLVAQVSQTRRFALYSRTGVVLMLRFESSWHGRSVDRVLTYSGRQITVESQKPSRITRQKTRCASESNTSVRVVFANGCGLDAPIRVVLAWEERGSCLNIFRMTNRGRISETFTNYEAKDSLRKSVDRVLTYSGRQIAVGSQKPSRITRQKTRCASESNTSVRVVFANRSGFDAPIRVVLAWEERGSCLNIFRTTNRGRISETFTNYEAKDSLRKSVDRVLTYSGRQIAVGSHKPSRITRQKTRCASESNTSVRVVFANRSGFDAPIGVVLPWEERGSCLNIFRDKKSQSNLKNIHEIRVKRFVAQVSQTRRFALYSRTGVVLMLRLESYWHGRSVDRVLTYSGRQIAVGSQKPSRITRQKTRCASESNTSVRVVFANRSGFDAPIRVVLAWEERGSCLNIFRTTNRGRISETFTNYEAKDSLRKNLHELRGKRLVAQVSQTRRFALYSRTGVVLMLRFESSWHGRSVDRVLTYSGRQIAVGSQKPSRITRQKTRCASESNTSVRVVFANRSGFDAPIGVVLAWEVRGSCLNIFRTTNRGRISETFTNYEAKDSLRK
ncbi:PAS domain-containing protein [Senna tora]|uniref:PAS domain-containing protein n=1 Tax=Senna tora TaxID=362788 RepID=A0A835CDA3_9FABA|nr:PAS domain-containing protein [Senna tora]